MSSGTKVFLAVFGVLVAALVLYYTTIGEEPANPPVVRGAEDPLVDAKTTAESASAEESGRLVTERRAKPPATSSRSGSTSGRSGSRPATASPERTASANAAPKQRGGPPDATPSDDPARSVAELPPLGESPIIRAAKEAAARKAAEREREKATERVATNDQPAAGVTPPSTGLAATSLTTIDDSASRAGGRRPVTAERPRYTDHFVQPGETMSSIAEAWFGDANKWDLIARANPLVDPNRLQPGDLLRMPPRVATRPVRTAAPARGTAERTHTVGSGETLSSIAKLYLGDMNAWRSVYDANRSIIGPDPDRLVVGMELVIPRQ